MTKRIPVGPIGFRLAYELEGLLRGISADGVITQSEITRVRHWLRENEPYSGIHPFSELARHISHILADGRIDPDECEDLLFVISKYTKVNPHFDQIRSGVQTLMGMFAGAAADAALDEAEVRALAKWTEEWQQLRGLWPFDECCAIITDMLATGRITEQQHYLFDLARQFPVAGHVTQEGEIAPLLVKGLCAMDPEIHFHRRRFVFTGESERAPRREIEQQVVARGGIAWPRVSADLDYLIVGADGSPFWAYSCYGRKVEQAYNLRKKGHRLTIVHEHDFWDALAGARPVGVA